MSTLRSERRLAAVLAADVVGYSRLVEADEAGTLDALRTLREQLLDPLVAEHRGRTVKLMGDGAIVEFGSVVDAVGCAVAMQTAIAQDQATVPAERRLVLRIGVNLGDLVVEGDDLLGDGVNVAARLEQLCEPGGVLVSGTAYDQLQGKLGLPLDFLGEQRVKNITRPVRAYRVRLDGKEARPRARRFGRRGVAVMAASMLLLLVLALGGWWLAGGSQVRGPPSIAVLPFDNLGGDAATGRLADGLTEDVITDLSRFRDLGVIARSSIMTYKDKAADARQVGRDLHVRYILEGSIQRAGGQVRVTAQLIDAVSGVHVWSQRWDRPLQDVFAVQTELSEQVAGQLGGYTGAVVGADRVAAMRKRPNDLTAYDLYLLAIESKQQETPTSIAAAIDLVQRSLEIDPSFARAWLLLGSCHAITLRWTDNWDRTHALYEEYMHQAVELDPMDAEAHAGLGFALAHDGDLEQAEAEFAEALRLNPNSADVLTRYAVWASTFGKPAEGAAQAARALQLNPDPPPWALRFLRSAFVMAEQYDQALEVQRRLPKTMFIDADYIEAAVSLAALQRGIEAKAMATEAIAKVPGISIERWTGDPGWSDGDRRRTVALMREAGFPACADEAEIKKGGIVSRLPECMLAAGMH